MITTVVIIQHDSAKIFIYSILIFVPSKSKMESHATMCLASNVRATTTKKIKNNISKIRICNKYETEKKINKTVMNITNLHQN